MKITETVTETEKNLIQLRHRKLTLTEKYIKEKTNHPLLNLLASGA